MTQWITKMHEFYCVTDIPALSIAVLVVAACQLGSPSIEIDSPQAILPSVEDLFFMLIAEGATVLACPLNVSLFNISPKQLIDGVKVADPAKYYK